MRKIKQIVCVFAVLTAFLLSGCKSKQVKSARFTKDGIERVESTLSRQFQYETFVGKADLTFSSGGKQLSSKAEVRMIKDRFIQISVQPLLGIEVARLTISPDTLLLIDRMGKQYVCEELTSLQRVLPKEINFAALQSLLTNQIFDVNTPVVQSKDVALLFEQKKQGDLLVINSRNGHRVDYDFMLNPESYLIQTNVLTKSGTTLLDCKYEDFRQVNEGKVFPFQTSLFFKIKDKAVNAAINYSNVNVNKRTDITISVPNKYKKLKIEDILSILLKN